MGDTSPGAPTFRPTLPRRGSAGSPRTFDPVRLGHLETAGWAAYYRREWLAALRAFVGMVATGFGMSRRRTLVGAWWLLQANRVWAPHPDNDPDAAREYMRRFYGLVRADGGLRLDPTQAARLEVEWWRLHRLRQREGADVIEPLATALVELYGYVYGADPQDVRPAAEHRVEAMELSDAWVRAGCHLRDPLLAQERLALVASYTALRRAVEPEPAAA